MCGDDLAEVTVVGFPAIGKDADSLFSFVSILSSSLFTLLCLLLLLILSSSLFSFACFVVVGFDSY